MTIHDTIINKVHDFTRTKGKSPTKLIAGIEDMDELERQFFRYSQYKGVPELLKNREFFGLKVSPTKRRRYLRVM